MKDASDSREGPPPGPQLLFCSKAATLCLMFNPVRRGACVVFMPLVVVMPLVVLSFWLMSSSCCYSAFIGMRGLGLPALSHRCLWLGLHREGSRSVGQSGAVGTVALLRLIHDTRCELSKPGLPSKAPPGVRKSALLSNRCYMRGINDIPHHV
ncbi:hypothetical protein MHYP_G00020200 [Metynnis hypsauchen]